jgi:dTDP-4-dehydrorhamnose 3,5-epimerase
MKVVETALKGVLIIEPDVYKDNRGFFMETYNRERYHSHGITHRFVQDNLSYSVRGTLRGLHYQLENQQAKLVQVIEGEIFDVAVDIRPDSPQFGEWIGVRLSSENNRQLFVAEGYAHGFCVLSKTAYFMYKCSDYYAPQYEGGVLWSDPEIGIQWPIADPILSDKDAGFSHLAHIDHERLPQ